MVGLAGWLGQPNGVGLAGWQTVRLVSCRMDTIVRLNKEKITQGINYLKGERISRDNNHLLATAKRL